MSVGLDFVDESNFIYNLDNNAITMHTLDDTNYFCTDYEFFFIKRKHEIRQEILEENPVITTEELDRRVEEILKTRDYIMGEKQP